MCREGAWGNGGMASLILNLGARWGVSGQLHASAVLPLGSKSLYVLNRM